MLGSEMNVFNLFSIPVLMSELLDFEKITTEEYEVLTSLEVKKREEEFENSTLLSNSSQILEDPRLLRIKETKLRYVDHYLSNVINVTNKFKMTSSWLTINQNGSSHERHSHGNVILSAVLYFGENFSDENLSNFYISQEGTKNIFKSFQFTYDIKNYNEYNSPSLNLKPKNNTIIIFPGWMLHGSEPHNDSNKRYCIGSNYFLNDHVGSGYHSLSIETKIKDSTI